jgi:hypothetical protein
VINAKIINLRVTPVASKKDNQRETIILEIFLWALFLGLVYLIIKGVFVMEL